MRLPAAIILALIWAVWPAAMLRAGDDPSAPRAGIPSVLVVGNPTLQASLERIYEGSATWRREIARAAATGRRIVVLTSDQVVVTDSQAQGELSEFDPGLLADVSLVESNGTRLDAVIIAINLRLIDDVHRRLGSPWSQRDADLDRILVHEVFGHALPYVLAGDRAGKCADPSPGEIAADACSIQRENVVRTELGLGRRFDAGLLSLAMARVY